MLVRIIDGSLQGAIGKVVRRGPLLVTVKLLRNIPNGTVYRAGSELPLIAEQVRTIRMSEVV